MQFLKKHKLLSAGMAVLPLLAAAAFLAMGNLTGAESGQAAGVPPVSRPAATAIQASASAVVYSGDIRARDTMVIAAKTAARISKVNADLGDSVHKGDLLVELDHQALDGQVKQAEAAVAAAQAGVSRIQAGARPELVAAAQAALDGAKAKLDSLQSGPTPEQIAAARTGITGAQAKLDQTMAGPPKEQIQLAQSQLDLAKKQVLYQQDLTDILLNPPTGKSTYSYSVKNDTLDVYNQQVQIAQDQLSALLAPPSPELIAQLRAAVDAAKAQMDILTAKPKPSDIDLLQSAIAAAQSQLDLAKSPFTSYDLDAANASLAQAEAALQGARTARDESFLVAPFDATVAARNLTDGAVVSPGQAILTLVSSGMDAVFAVNETDIPGIASGMPASVTLTAYPGQTFSGAVRTISPVADPGTRNYQVFVSLDPDSRLRAGMFAGVTLQP